MYKEMNRLKACISHSNDGICIGKYGFILSSCGFSSTFSVQGSYAPTSDSSNRKNQQSTPRFIACGLFRHKYMPIESVFELRSCLRIQDDKKKIR